MNTSAEKKILGVNQFTMYTYQFIGPWTQGAFFGSVM